MYAPWSCSSLPLPLTNTQIHTSLCTTSSQHIQVLLKTICYSMKEETKKKRGYCYQNTKEYFQRLLHVYVNVYINWSGQNFIALFISYWFPHFLTGLWLWLFEYERFNYILLLFQNVILIQSYLRQEWGIGYIMFDSTVIVLVSFTNLSMSAMTASLLCSCILAKQTC